MLKSIPGGVYPTMVTPYTKENAIDYSAVLQLLDWYRKKGVRAIFAICQSSEIFFLSFEERLALLRFIMKNKPEDMTVVASGHVSSDRDTMLREANAFIETGIDGYVFISNRFASEDEPDDILSERMLSAADALPEIALGVYECPYPYKRVLSPAVLKALAGNHKFRFLKDTCCNIEMIAQKLDAVKGSELKIFNANSATLLPSLQLGCAGTLSMAECQCYPVNAKYYLSLEGLDINIDSRARSKSDFGPSRKSEIEEMRALTLAFEEHLL